MGRYRLLVKPSAVAEIDNVARKSDRRRIVERIRALGDDPRPYGSEKLAGRGARYRVRQGAYRILYAVDDNASTVEIVKVGHRKEVYR